MRVCLWWALMNAGKPECTSNGEEKMGSIKKRGSFLLFHLAYRVPERNQKIFREERREMDGD